jgi:SAM-dependent methyltransferase
MWNERYSEPGFAYGTEPNDFLVEVEPLFPRNARILSLAEGEGRNAVWLAQRGHRVVAVDGSSVGLLKAAALAAEKRVALTTVVADLADFAIDVDSFDVIVSVWAHVPPSLRKPLHARCSAGLTPHGVFVLEAYRPAQVTRTTGGPKDPLMCMSRATLTDELVGLHLERCDEIVRVVREGEFHNGESDVVQCVARRRA